MYGVRTCVNLNIHHNICTYIEVHMLWCSLLFSETLCCYRQVCCLPLSTWLVCLVTLFPKKVFILSSLSLKENLNVSLHFIAVHRIIFFCTNNSKISINLSTEKLIYWNLSRVLLGRHHRVYYCIFVICECAELSISIL